MFIVLYLRGISSPLYQLLYSADFNKISVAYFQCEIIIYCIIIQYKCTEIYCAAAWTSCPLPSVLPSQHRPQRHILATTGFVFLTFSKSIIYTLCCTLGCLSALLWFWLYLRKSQSRWACREQGAIHAWTDILQQGDYELICEKTFLDYLIFCVSHQM